MNKILALIIILLLSTPTSAGLISISDYNTGDTLTAINLNLWQNTVENVINGGIDNDNVNTTGGYRLLEILGTLPAATTQGRVVYHTTDNILYFDTGTAMVASPSYSGTAAQGDTLYYDGTGNWDLFNKDTTATRYLSNRGTSNNPKWDVIDLDNGVENTLALINGGTGEKFDDPGEDKLLYWDDTVGAMAWLTPASGVTVSNGSVSVGWTLLFNFALGGGSCVAGSNGIVLNDSIVAAEAEIDCGYWQVYADTYRTLIETKIKKVAGIDTVNFYARIWNESALAGDYAQVKVNVGGVETIVAGSAQQQTPEWVNGTIDISGLTDGTVYTVTILLNNIDGLQNAYMDSIIAWGSDDH